MIKTLEERVEGLEIDMTNLKDKIQELYVLFGRVSEGLTKLEDALREKQLID